MQIHLQGLGLSFLKCGERRWRWGIAEVRLDMLPAQGVWGWGGRREDACEMQRQRPLPHFVLILSQNDPRSPGTFGERYWTGEISHEAQKCLPFPGLQRELISSRIMNLKGFSTSMPF